MGRIARRKLADLPTVPGLLGDHVEIGVRRADVETTAEAREPLQFQAAALNLAALDRHAGPRRDQAAILGQVKYRGGDEAPCTLRLVLDANLSLLAGGRLEEGTRRIDAEIGKERRQM